MILRTIYQLKIDKYMLPNLILFYLVLVYSKCLKDIMIHDQEIKQYDLQDSIRDYFMFCYLIILV